MKGWTIGIVIGAAALLIAWDVYVALRGTNATISAIVLGAARQHPVVPFLFGVLMGHLFWFQRVKP